MSEKEKWTNQGRQPPANNNVRLADNLKISQISMMKILRDLKDTKIVLFHPEGSLGGYSLYKDAEDI